MLKSTKKLEDNSSLLF